jgi:hypothetical protein
MPRSEGVEAPGAGWVVRATAACFWGGAGTAVSRPAAGVGAPRGPRGSSTASSLVDCTPYCRRRGPRPAGERGADEALGAVVASVLVAEVRD